METQVNYASSSLGDEALESRFENALRAIRLERAPVEPQLIGTLELQSERVIERFDPCEPGSLVGAAFAATATQVTDAITSAQAQTRMWRNTAYAERIRCLRRARDTVVTQIAELAAIVSAETGKTRIEAVGEAQEVVDMIEHYCALMEQHDGYRLPLKSSGTESNEDVLVPWGVFAVIAPFNFPIALSVGMMVGAIVTGNTVVLKPSDKTPRSTATIARIIRDTLPAGVLNVIHGGADTGRLLADGAVSGIAFTGSAEVGWELVNAKASHGLPRPVLAEMGGQNPAIVTRHADLEIAAEGIVRSAFGLSGQKCSACRRVVVEAVVAEDLVALIKAASERLTVGDPINRASDLGPVIDDAIAGRIDAALQIAHTDGVVVSGGRVAELSGNYFNPIVVTDLPHGHRLTRDELFGPFLTVTTTPDFPAAMAEANAVRFGLSAGIYSGDQSELDTFVDEIEAGVIYVNRAAGATTGAWPGVQSFCGWKLSGSTGKGGLGNWYLQGFMREQSRTIVSL